jgi:hypothetical protein
MGIPFLDHAFDASDPFGSAVPLLPFLFPDRKPANGDGDGHLRIQPLAQGTTNGVSLDRYCPLFNCLRYDGTC